VLFAVGVGLLAASTAYGAYDRYFNQEQSGWQALLGGAADASGISAVYAGITGRDLATQHHLSLTPAQQRQMLTEGSIQVMGSGLLLYGGVRSFLRGRVPVAPRRTEQVIGEVTDAEVEAAIRSVPTHHAPTPQNVDISKLIPPSSRPVADPAKLARHGPFDWNKYTPIIVETDGQRLWLMDGMTRVENARRAGITQLPAYIFRR
jgi:hypothetical protein